MFFCSVRWCCNSKVWSSNNIHNVMYQSKLSSVSVSVVNNNLLMWRNNSAEVNEPHCWQQRELKEYWMTSLSFCVIHLRRPDNVCKRKNKLWKQSCQLLRCQSWTDNKKMCKHITTHTNTIFVFKFNSVLCVKMTDQYFDWSLILMTFSLLESRLVPFSCFTQRGTYCGMWNSPLIYFVNVSLYRQSCQFAVTFWLTVQYVYFGAKSFFPHTASQETLNMLGILKIAWWTTVYTTAIILGDFCHASFIAERYINCNVAFCRSTKSATLSVYICVVLFQEDSRFYHR